MTDIRELILHSAPPWMKDAMVSAYGLMEHRKRHGRFYRQWYEALSKLSASAAEDVHLFQKERLRDLLLEAQAFSPWYKGEFEKAKISPHDIHAAPPMDLLERLPFLEKDTLKNCPDQVVSANPERPAYATVSTSGTSGSPMKVEFDAEGRQMTYAEWRRYYDWLGLPQQFRSVRFSGRIIVKPSARKPPFWAWNRIDDQLFMSAYHLKPENIPAYIEKLNAFRPDLIDGYPSAIFIIAQAILRYGTKLDFEPTAISLTAETLMDPQRHIIEKAFGCKVFNQYASSEGAPWIVECLYGNYHLWLDTGVFEFIDSKPLDEESRMAELVVTSFRNFRTPLIRYRIGDYIQTFNNPPVCPCGTPYPVVKGVVGRNDDILYTEEKGSVGRLDPAYKGVNGIRQSKIIQHNVESIEVLVVPDDRFDEDQRDLLLKNLRDRLGKSITIELVILESIPLGKTGKLKAVERRFPLPYAG